MGTRDEHISATSDGDELLLRPVGEHEAAELLGLSRETLMAWRSRRPGYGPPYVKMGKSVRYRRKDLLDWMEARVDRGERTTVRIPTRGVARPPAQTAGATGRTGPTPRRKRVLTAPP
ncbi:hypothetical protein Back2_00510 [Nocardioides baekrokdamisoli]|uniref:Helix-turn-helix domain-containing protein n=1 Tax=Nocardioides baekrokdamisoli TaxID=1804624 RepID=A0A3G9IX66_9ACTN|nr:hypothetical protein Back2_00510 [Nocardioides baekrokdamisoli]